MQESRRPWTKDQDNAVIEIVQQIGLKNWPLVSTIMRQRFNVTGRSGKQCRQRWHNQLNPEVNKKPWTEQEEKLLFEAHKTYRNRWIDISKLFQGRTDNSIKNHFYSTIRRSLRRICKLLGNKNSTSELRNIKPSILSKIFQYSQLKGDQVTQQNQYIVNESKIITQELLNFARCKTIKSMETLQDNKRKNLQYLIQKLNQFSKNYSAQKDTYKKNLNFRAFPSKNPKVIILKSQQGQSSEKGDKQKQRTPQKSINGQKMSKKKYLYDWQQFQKRCLYVKKVFQNQTQYNRGDSPSMKNQEDEPSSQIFPSINNFYLQQKQSQKSDKAQTYTTPRLCNRKGFEPYGHSSSQGLNYGSGYDRIVQKLKFQISYTAGN